MNSNALTNNKIMFLESMPGLNKEVQNTLYYQSKRKPTDQRLVIDRCNLLIDFIVKGNKHYEDVNDFEATPIHSSILREQLGRYPEEYINLLKGMGIIYVDPHYTTQKVANEINAKYDFDVAFAESKKYGLTKKVKTIEKVGVLCSRTESRLLRHKSREFYKAYKDPINKKIINNIFQLEYRPTIGEKRLQEVIEEGKERKIKYYDSLHKELIKMNPYTTPDQYIKAKFFHYHISDKVGRAFHLVASMPRDYRKALIHNNGSKLCLIDGKSFQPTMLTLKFIKSCETRESKESSEVLGQTNNIQVSRDKDTSCCALALKKEMKTLQNDTLNGIFYKKIAVEALRQGDVHFYKLLTTNKATYKKLKKKILGNGLYGKLRTKRNALKEEKYLMAVYPNFMNWIRNIKITYGYKAVPIMAQRLESNIFVHGFFKDVDYFAVPIHDAILCKLSDAKKVKERLIKLIMNEYSLTIEQTKNMFDTENL